MNRRQFLASSAACALLPATGRAEAMRLRAEPVTVRLLPDEEGLGPTAMLGFNGRTPGPEIRVVEGGRVSVAFENGIGQPSAIHWHGIHIDNAMDGVPGLTQDAVPPARPSSTTSPRPIRAPTGTTRTTGPGSRWRKGSTAR